MERYSEKPRVHPHPLVEYLVAIFGTNFGLRNPIWRYTTSMTVIIAMWYINNIEYWNHAMPYNIILLIIVCHVMLAHSNKIASYNIIDYKNYTCSTDILFLLSNFYVLIS